MWDFISEIASAIWDGIKSIWNTCKRIIKAVISFVHDLLDGLFEILEDLFGDDMPSSVKESPVKPFIADMDKLIQNAPVSDQGLFQQKKNNFVKGVYDTRTKKIISPTYVAADSVDQKTKNEMGNEPIIVIG